MTQHLAKVVAAVIAGASALVAGSVAMPAPAHAYVAVENNPPPSNARMKPKPGVWSIKFQFNKNETRVLARNGGVITAVGLTSSVLGPEVGIPAGAAAAYLSQVASNAVADKKCLQIKLYYFGGPPTPQEYSGKNCN